MGAQGVQVLNLGGTMYPPVPIVPTPQAFIIFVEKPDRSLVECYSNHTTTLISIQTAGLAFGGTGLCSYRVSGVDGSCAEHLTVESYTVVILIITIIFPTLTHSFIPTALVCKSFPP